MKKLLIMAMIAMTALAFTQNVDAFSLDQGYRYTFKYTNWEVIPDEAGSTSGVPDEINGIYKVTTIQRAPAEIVGGVVVVDNSQFDSDWWSAGDAGEFLDGTFTLKLLSTNGVVSSWDVDLDMWLDTADVSSASVAAGFATAGGAGTGGDGDLLIAELESLFYTTSPHPLADGGGPNFDLQAVAGFKFVTNNTGLDWYTDPITGVQFGLTASIAIENGIPWDFFSQDPLIGTAPVPEPASLVLLGAGLVGGYLRKRKSI